MNSGMKVQETQQDLSQPYLNVACDTELVSKDLTKQVSQNQRLPQARTLHLDGLARHAQTLDWEKPRFAAKPLTTVHGRWDPRP